MKLVKITGAVAVLLIVFAASPLTVYAATQPTLGVANTFSVLASSFVNTATGTTLNGDLGYTTPPAVTPTVTGNTHVADATYNQAGIDQAIALASINSQPCTFSFAVGAIDLASDTTHGTIGVYTPGVYCITGAASIGGGGTITLSGAGVVIFRSTGAFTTSAGSIVALAGGASACSTFWAPGAAATLGANTTFMGTIIDPSGITIGSTAAWTGRALAFGGTVSTTTDTITTVPTCAVASVNAAAAAAAAAAALAASQTPKLPNTGSAPLANEANHANRFALLSLPATVIALVSTAFVIRRHT